MNLPNWLSLTLPDRRRALADGIDDVKLLLQPADIDLRHATLTRSLRFRDVSGRVTTVIARSV